MTTKTETSNNQEKIYLCCAFQPANTCFRKQHTTPHTAGDTGHPCFLCKKVGHRVYYVWGIAATATFLAAKLFHDFPVFFIVFDHANACASRHFLVKIHNIFVIVFVTICCFHLIKQLIASSKLF